MCYITVSHISKVYTMGTEIVPAVSDVSFTIERGEFIAVTGPSGCGRSLYTQSAASLALFRRREAGIVYQFYNLVPELTAEENLILPALMDGQKIPESR